MKIYNTLSRRVEEFEPLDPPQVGLYACGPTVYDYAHIGHLRKYSMDDVLIKTLKHAGYEVKHVQNVTDVGHLASDADTGEDKMEKGAKKYNLTAQEIAQKFEEYFYKSMDLMHVDRPDVSCRATEHIQEQLDLVKKLEEKDFTYVIQGDGVYFDTSKLDDYGKLSSLDRDQLEEGIRVGKVEGKKNPTDFALWKFERPGENRAMSWASPWAKKSFPGWHVECSAMSMKYLGSQFDVHTGGIDHIPVHHPNEIAQSETATGEKPFVKYWVHHNHLMVEGEKMSKSKGNFYTIDDILEKGYEPMALRLLFLSSHYRSQQNFTWDSLKASQKSWKRLQIKVTKFKQRAETNDLDELSQEAKNFKSKFFTHLENDLKTPEALAVLWEVVASGLSALEKLSLLYDFDQIFSLNLREINNTSKTLDLAELTKEARELLISRRKARKIEDWQEADILRKRLEDLGYRVIDTEEGQRVKYEKSKAN